MSSLSELARRLLDVERKISRGVSQPQLANSAIESGAIQAYEDDTQTMIIGRQFDGTYTSATVNGPVPPTPQAPTIMDGTEGITVVWSGLFTGGAIVPMDFLRVDVYLGTTPTFFPSPSNQVGSIVSPRGGQVTLAVAPGVWYARLICWAQSGQGSGWSTSGMGQAFPIVASTDGSAPSSSPAVELIGGLDILYAKWTPIVNADPVKYEVHIGTSAGFKTDTDPTWIPGTDPATLVGTTSGSSFTIKNLPGPAPAVGAPDTRALLYDTQYWVKIVARDDDGRAVSAGTADDATIFKVTTDNIAANTIIGGNILGGTITGDLLSATMVISSEFWTALTGQRAGFTPQGFFAYKPDDSLMLKIPTAANEDAIIDATVIARGLTATGAVTMRSNVNAVEKDGVVILRNGVAAPAAVPQMSTNYVQQALSTASLTAAQKTGTLGTFDFIGSEASCLEWNTGSYWVVHQVRAGGTRAWFFNYDGTPRLTSGVYFNEYPNWEIWSVINITTSTAPKNGVYRMARWLPTNTWYLMCPQGSGFNKYTRLNSAAPPVVGTNGTDVFIAEVAGTQLNIRYYTPNGDQNTISAPTTAYQSAQGFTAAKQLSNVTYNSAGFDIGAGRYLVSERGFPTDNKLIYTSGTNANSIFLGGSGGSWVSATINAETFETAHTNPRCTGWDGTNFWTLGGDGVLYQYTDTYWDKGNAATPSTIWAQHTFLDFVGTTHETTPGPAKSFVWKRRSQVAFNMPPIPGAGTADEPNLVTIYVGRGTTQPSNANMRLQNQTASPVLYLPDFAFTSGANPPTVNSFPLTNPGKIRSDDSSMVISGDGSIQATTFTDLSTWHVVGAAGEPAYANGSAVAGYALQFRKDGYGTVHIKGNVATTVTLQTTIFTLPAGYRPAANTAGVVYMIYCNPLGVIGRAVISPSTGAVDVQRVVGAATPSQYQIDLSFTTR